MNPPAAEIIAFLKQRLPIIDFGNDSTPQSATADVLFTGIARGDQKVDDLSNFIERCFARSRNCHVIIRGESGTGKTTLLKTFPQLIARETQSDKSRPGFYIDVHSVGPDDSRGLIESLLALTEQFSEILLGIDGFANLVPRPQGQDNFHLLRSLAQRPQLRLLATLSNSEAETAISEQKLLREWFEVVELAEPAEAELLEMCSRHVLQRVENSTWEVIPDFAAQAIEAARTFLINDYNPGKSIRLIDRAIENLEYDRIAAPGQSTTLDRQRLLTAVQEISGIDLTRFREARTQGLRDLLEEIVFGQPEATMAMARELEMFRAGLTDPHKPASVVLLAGTTGVGKTELAKAVCQLYSQTKQLRVFTMGNYTEPHSVSSVIGVPPGYVGHEDGGQIVNQLLADPFSVFLLDEAEKAHANVWKPFLNLFDEGWIVDQRGQKAFARNAIFLITTNAGEKVARQLFERDEPYDTVVDKVKQAILRYRPERGTQPVFNEQFLARINEVIVFRPLDQAAFEQITSAQLVDLQHRWQQRVGLGINFAPELSTRIAEFCHQKNQASQDREGGRLARHVIKSTLEAPLLDYVKQTPLADRITISMTTEKSCETISDLKSAFVFQNS